MVRINSRCSERTARPSSRRVGGNIVLATPEWMGPFSCARTIYLSEIAGLACATAPLCVSQDLIFRREFVLLYSASARIVMKPLLFALCVVFAFGGLSAQKPAWQPAPGHTEIAIWPRSAPDPQPVAGPEYAETSGKDFLLGGRPAVRWGQFT